MESLKLRSGRVLTFDEEQHRYTIDSYPVSGITGLIRRHRLDENFKFIPEEAKEKGIRIHEAVYFDGEHEAGLNPLPLDESTVEPEELGYVEAARRARRELKLEATGLEVLVGSDLYWYATKIDFIGLAGVDPIIINWKSGPEYKSYAVQMQLESLLAAEVSGVMPRKILGIHLRADGRYFVADHTRKRKDMKLAKAIAIAQGESMNWRIANVG